MELFEDFLLEERYVRKLLELAYRSTGGLSPAEFASFAELSMKSARLAR